MLDRDPRQLFSIMIDKIAMLPRSPNVRRTQFSFTTPDNFYYNDSKLMTAVNMAYDLTNREEFTR